MPAPMLTTAGVRATDCWSAWRRRPCRRVLMGGLCCRPCSLPAVAVARGVQHRGPVPGGLPPSEPRQASGPPPPGACRLAHQQQPRPAQLVGGQPQRGARRAGAHVHALTGGPPLAWPPPAAPAGQVCGHRDCHAGHPSTGAFPGFLAWPSACSPIPTPQPLAGH